MSDRLSRDLPPLSVFDLRTKSWNERHPIRQHPDGVALVGKLISNRRQQLLKVQRFVKSLAGAEQFGDIQDILFALHA